MHTNIILGPPGTGKTTTLLDLMEKVMKGGVAPNHVGFISFTRKATNEARSRAVRRFDLDEKNLPYLKTIHALAFASCGLSTTQVMQKKHYMELGEALGVEVTGFSAIDDLITFGMKKGDRMFHHEGLARTRGITLERQWQLANDEEIMWPELQKLQSELQIYKREHDLIDYQDMLEMFLAQGVPKVEVLFVDEAQDLSVLQWRVVKEMMAKSQVTYVAGDDDQAIFGWAGADVRTFIDLPGDVRVLDQSYRVPSRVHGLAHKIIKQIIDRREKTWKPMSEEGRVERHFTMEEVDMGEGTWLMLARNRYMLDRYEQHCRQMGYAFDSITGSPLKGKALRAILLWETLRKGKELVTESVVEVYAFMSTFKGLAYGAKAKMNKHGAKQPWKIPDLKEKGGLLTEAPWFDALDRIPEEDREYFRSLLRRGEELTTEPRIRISTIHGVKGGEADHVVLSPEMAPRTFQEMENNMDEERRVWYVAATRARKSLHLLEPRSFTSFDL